MVRTTFENNIFYADITNSISASGITYYIGGEYNIPIKKETKIEKRNRIAIERNRKSWVTFNERKPNVKQVIKPICIFRK